MKQGPEEEKEKREGLLTLVKETMVVDGMVEAMDYERQSGEEEEEPWLEAEAALTEETLASGRGMAIEYESEVLNDLGDD